jgi:LAO/AO transport system kinase
VPQALRVLDAAGCDVIIVETVGVGQAEVDIASLADTTVVLLAPGMGDGIQAAKAGILEVADIFVVNKADRDGADQVVRDLRYMQSLGGRHSVQGAWRPSIVKTVASRGEGISELRAALEKHREWMIRHGELDRRRIARAAAEIEAIAVAHVRDRITAVHGSAALSASAARVVAGETDPYTAASDLVAALAN